ncbi:transporter [Tsuneonella sp. YG55]|uniref:Transporter n=1 Tax=Tsuneonella litorea TaxID=2976475 RepID=A0A9X2W099_9SPHN|nr:transporter [Tsuneonella litorea]MCT2558337.1 transporter [Tsuneonella litorea]
MAQQSPETPSGENGTRVQFSTGLDYEQGDYGTDTQMEKESVPLSLVVAKGRLRASAQTSYVRLRAPGNVVAPSGPLGLPILVDPTRPDTVDTRQGMGDLHLSAAYDLPVEGFNATLGTGVKVPTASVDKGLGTGKADYSVRADLAKPLGSVTPFAGVAYTVTGDPDGFDLRNALSAQAGASLRLAESTSAHLGYAFAQSQVAGGEDDQRIVGGLNTGVGKNLSLGFYGSGGLTDGASDFGGGVTLGIRLGR